MVVKRRALAPPICAAATVETESAARMISVRNATRVTRSFYFSHPLPGHDECKGEKQQQTRDLGRRGIVVEVWEPLSELLRRIDRPEPQFLLRPVIGPYEQRKE